MQAVFGAIGIALVCAASRSRFQDPRAAAPAHPGGPARAAVVLLTEPTSEGVERSAARPRSRPGIGRILIGLAGIALGFVGARGIWTHQAESPPRHILPWWIGLVILHDGIIAPTTALIGWALVRRLPAAARAPVQFAGIVCGLVTLFSLPLLYRQGRGFEGSTLMTRDYRAHLIEIVATVVVVTIAVSVGHIRHLRGGHVADGQAGAAPAPTVHPAR